MNTYTFATPEFALEALEAGLEKIATRVNNLTLAARAALIFVGGPLIGLAFVIAVPVMGLALAVYYTTKLIAVRWAKIARYIKNIALFFAAPFIGLVYLFAVPFVGLGTLVYIGVKAARR